MNWYLIELPDGAPTPYATETEGGTIYGWGDMPKRKVDLDALSKVIEDLLGTWGDGKVDADDADTYEHKIAERIRKAMISQPMAGKSNGEIAETRERAKAKLEEMGYEFVNTLFTDAWYSEAAMEERGVVQVPLCYLAKSLENMSLCHAAYFCKGWENARGCRIEHDAAIAYGLEVLYED